MFNNCNGHGSCTISTGICSCFEGWGADTDIAIYKSPDCSLRTCAAHKSWGTVPQTTALAHGLEECSGRGNCDRASGKCVCFPPFVGDACQRMTCPNDCSGHGQCVNMKRMATMAVALPLAPASTYFGDPFATTWDEEMIFGCVCDSYWTVGLTSGATQEPEWFGADCSLRHCPSNDDPTTTAVNELDCGGKQAADSIYSGETGNLCHVDCSNRGTCNFKTGQCKCFTGYYGESCHGTSALAS